MTSQIKYVIRILGVLLLVLNIKAQNQNDVCSKRGEICAKFSNCVNASVIVKSKGFVRCIVENYGPGLCCNPQKQKLLESSTSATVQSTSQVQSRPTLSSQPQQQNTTARSQNLRWSNKDSKAIALDYCKKYKQYKYEKIWRRSDIPGRPGKFQNEIRCVIVKKLIVNGQPAEAKEYPHMALIGYGNRFKEVNWACGGSLISDKFILSAAHCGETSRLGPPRWALLGDLNITSETDDAKPVVYSIVKVHDHPDYNKDTSNNDISLFELNTTVSLSPYVRPACLYTADSDPSVGTSSSITGWGLTDTAGKRSDHLLKATIKVVEDQRCEKSFTPSYNPTTMLCAGDLATGKDTCNGDSGGPIQLINARESCMWDVFGVTSHGSIICGNQEDPAVYARVSFYLDWIQSIVWP